MITENELYEEITLILIKKIKEISKITIGTELNNDKAKNLLKKIVYYHLVKDGDIQEK